MAALDDDGWIDLRIFAADKVALCWVIESVGFRPKEPTEKVCQSTVNLDGNSADVRRMLCSDEVVESYWLFTRKQSWGYDLSWMEPTNRRIITEVSCSSTRSSMRVRIGVAAK